MKKIIALITILFIFGVSSVYAMDSSCLTAVVNDISPTSIKVGGEFTLGILVDSCGEAVADNVSFELTDVSDYIGIKEPKYKEIGKMGYSNSNRFLVYHMKVDGNAVPGIYNFNYILRSGSEGLLVDQRGNFSVTVIGDKAELAIASVKTNPVLPIQGDTVELTLRIENSGEGTAKSVKIYADHPYQGIKQSFIGTLESNEDAPAIFTFVVDKFGGVNFPVTISYNDDFGTGEVKTNVEVNVLEKKSNYSMLITVIIVCLISWFL
jgi:hypothetical protein